MPKGQTEIPGIERKTNKDLEEAIARYKSCQEKRLNALRAELEAKEDIVNLMHENKLTLYRSDEDYVAKLEAGPEKLRVKKVDEEAGDEEEGEA